MKIIISTIKSWNIKEAKKFIKKNKDKEIYIITNKNELTYEYINKIKPNYIFFPHWSWKIPMDVYQNFECIIFHITDLPYGRGGSPLQNLIIRGFKQTKISAIKAEKEIDSGPIYIKKNLSLEGTAEIILKRSSKIIFNEMIPIIIEQKPKPIPQIDTNIVNFKRRTIEQSSISKLDNIQKAYDYIRMLDGEGYPNAFIKTDKLIFKFFNATLKNNHIITSVKIIRREK